jgi:hypothetical protein
MGLSSPEIRRVPAIIEGVGTFKFRHKSGGGNNAIPLLVRSSHRHLPQNSHFFNSLNHRRQQTNAHTNGTFHFSDPQWTNNPGRFYRISAP